MYPSARARVFGIGVVVLLMTAFSLPVAADVELTELSWETIGTDVRFSLRFHNTDPTLQSGAVSGEMHSQPFGAFVPNTGLITTFDIPPIPPDSFFDVFYEIPLSSLPPSAERITEGVANLGVVERSALALCPPDLFWAGNVDVFWNGAGGAGQSNAHFGTLQICPGGQQSYIHVIVDCQSAGGTSWNFGPLCPGWSATLLSDDGAGNPGGPAPNPLPSGLFDGWICVSADLTVPFGATCCFDLNMTCGGVTVPIHMCAEACECPPVPTDSSSMGQLKSHYED